MSKLFVYGINASCTREVIEGEFGRCGEVTDVYNTEKGYAFVTMADEEAANNAVRTLNGATIDGQQIKVDIARQREDRGGGGGGGGYGGGRGGGGGGYGGGRGGNFIGLHLYLGHYLFAIFCVHLLFILTFFKYLCLWHFLKPFSFLLRRRIRRRTWRRRIRGRSRRRRR
jgi:cold-inducible RNA-binding protein